MTDERRTIRLSEFDMETIEMARQRWPSHAANFTALLRLILSDWRHSKESGGKSGQLIQIIAQVEQINARLAAIEQTQLDIIRPLTRNGQTE